MLQVPDHTMGLLLIIKTPRASAATNLRKIIYSSFTSKFHFSKEQRGRSLRVVWMETEALKDGSHNNTWHRKLFQWNEVQFCICIIFSTWRVLLPNEMSTISTKHLWYVFSPVWLFIGLLVHLGLMILPWLLMWGHEAKMLIYGC